MNLPNFEKIFLPDFLAQKKGALLRRREKKFLVPRKILPEIFEFLRANFLCIAEKNREIFFYKTIYFDTKNFYFFFAHKNGRKNRAKLRIREYENRRIFLELKEKTNKNFKKKTRQIFGGNFAAEKNFFEKKLEKFNLQNENFEQKLTIFYRRINFVSRDFAVRASVDFEISADEKKILENFAILEIKFAEKNSLEKIFEQFLRRKFKIRPTGFSKYCVGICAKNPELPRNSWKKIFEKYQN